MNGRNALRGPSGFSTAAAEVREKENVVIWESI
jgi:hypothetical protein